MKNIFKKIVVKNKEKKITKFDAFLFRIPCVFSTLAIFFHPRDFH
jgi:hypothetical protein